MDARTGRPELNVAREDPVPRRWGEPARLFLAVLLAYSAGAVLSWQSLGATTGPTFFPPAGIALAALLLTRRLLWPVVIAAAVLGEVLVDLYHGAPPLSMAGFTVANTAESLVGASLVSAWCRGTPDLRRRRDLVLFVVGGCLVGPVVGGLIGGGVVAHGGTGWLTHAITWFAGDGLGVLVVAAPVLLWPRQFRVLTSRPVETVAVLTVAALLAFLTFRTATPPGVLVLPVMAWAAFRLDMLGAALTGAVTAVVANSMAPVAFTQGFLAVTVLVGMLIAQESGARAAALRAREGERREQMRLGSLADLAQRLSAALSPDDIAAALVSNLVNEAGATALNLGLLSRDRQTLDWFVLEGYPPPVIQQYGRGVPISERTVATDVVRTGRPILLRTRAEFAAAYPARAQWLRTSDAHSLVGWPLTAGGEPVGTLMLAWSDPQPLDPAQLAFVSAVASMVSQALVRAQIYVDQHARAAVLQSAVLPTGPVGGLDVAVLYRPAAGELGGGWYDIMTLPDERTYFAVGDVAGRGLPAVEDMAQLRSAARVFAHQGLTPSQMLGELNGFTRTASHGKSATMAVVVRDDQGLSYCSAGNPPALLRRADSGEVIWLSDADGPRLGRRDDAAFRQDRVDVGAGDILVMFTDGLVESRHTGIAAAAELIARWGPGTALSDGCEALLARLGRRRWADDVCVVAVRFAS